MENRFTDIGEIKKTPFFLFDELRILDSVASIRDALSRHWANSVLSYSVKTNSLPCVLKVLADSGVWAEVVSEDEYNLALSCGFRKGDFVCNGPAKSQRFIDCAIASGAVLHLDGMSEVQDFFSRVGNRAVNLGVRVTATEQDFSGEALSGKDSSRFGLSIRDGDFEELCKLLDQHKNVTLTSLHLHCNTKSRSKIGFSWLAKFFARIVRKYRLDTVNTFDIGGSFGHDFDFGAKRERRWPSWDEYFEEIANVLSSEGFSSDELRLIIEPGSALISNAADYYATIVGKRIYDGIIMMQMDGSRIHIDPHFARQLFQDVILVQGEDDGTEGEWTNVLCGSTCLEKDRVFLGEKGLKCMVGKRLMFAKTGAYTIGLSPCFFINSIPDVWMRSADGFIKCVSQSNGLRWNENFTDKER